jgi:TolB protein
MKKAGIAAALLIAGFMLVPSAASAVGRIVYVSTGGGADREVYVMNGDGSGQTPLTDNAATDKDTSWSPDGKRILFVSDRDGNDEIYTMAADGSDVRRLTFTTDEEYALDWSPDGRTITFSRNDPMGLAQVWLMNPDGSNQRVIPNGPGSTDAYGARFSPDGQSLAYADEIAGNLDVWVMGSDGSNRRRLTEDVAVDYSPHWSADGKQIYFISRRSQPGDDVWKMDAAGLVETPVTTDTSANRAPSPSRDGLALVNFVSPGEGVDQEIARMNADGSGRIDLTVNSYADNSPESAPAVRCGKRFATIVGTSSSETLRGGPGPDVISGLGGKDKIRGLGGKDIVCGEAGNDLLNGGSGRDRLIGGKGKDRTIGGKGKDQCLGGKGKDKGSGCEKEKSL